MNTLRPWLIVAFIAVLPGRALGPHAAAPPQSAISQRPLSDRGAGLDRLEKWLTAIERHKPGESDSSVSEIRPLGRTDLQDLWIDVRAVLLLMRDPERRTFFLESDGTRIPRQVLYNQRELDRLRTLARNAAEGGDMNRILKRGALLHTDIATLTQTQAVSRATSSAPGPLRVTFNDGRQTGLDAGDWQWGMARTLLDAVTPGPSSEKPEPAHDEIVRLWYRATAAYQQSREQYESGHLERALQLFPIDADILFLDGCLHETYSAPRIQRVIRSGMVPRGVTFAVATERTEVRQAEVSLRGALKSNPGLTEARIHLGRVLGRLGRHLDAANELREAVSRTEDALLLYYAELFLGAEMEALGDRERARRSYERAATLYPRAQSPRLALSHLAARHGDRPAALAAIQPALRWQIDETNRNDPWWTYHIAPGRDADNLLGEFRARVSVEDRR